MRATDTFYFEAKRLHGVRALRALGLFGGVLENQKKPLKPRHRRLRLTSRPLVAAKTSLLEGTGARGLSLLPPC